MAGATSNFFSEFFGEAVSGMFFAKAMMEWLKHKTTGDWSTRPSPQADEAAYAIWSAKLTPEERDYLIKVMGKLTFGERTFFLLVMEQIYQHKKTTIEEGGKSKKGGGDEKSAVGKKGGGDKSKPKKTTYDYTNEEGGKSKKGGGDEKSAVGKKGGGDKSKPKKTTYDYTKGIQACCDFIRRLQTSYPDPAAAAQNLRDTHMVQVSTLERWSKAAWRKLKKLLEKLPPDQWAELLRNFPKDMSNANAVVAQLNRWAEQMEARRAELRRQRQGEHGALVIFSGTFIFLTLLIGLALLAGGLLEVNRSQPKPQPAVEKGWQMDVDDYTKSTQPTYTPPMHDNTLGGILIGIGATLLLGGGILLIVRPRRPEIAAATTANEGEQDEHDGVETAPSAAESTSIAKEAV